MNSSPKDSPPINPTESATPSASPSLGRDGLGLPHLSADAKPRTNESSLEPDTSVDLDETVRKDKEVADKEHAENSP